MPRAVPHVLLVGARDEIVGKLTGLPVAVTFIQRSDAPGATASRAALATRTVDLSDLDAVCRVAQDVHARRPIDAVLSLTEPGLYPAAVAAQRLGVRSNPVEAVRNTRDKTRMRRRLRENGVDTTAWRLCDSINDARDLLGDVPEGIVLKPALGAGSAGIATVTSPGDLAAAWEWCQAAGEGAVLAEERLVGEEFSLEAISHDGRHELIAVTRKETTGPPHFIELAHSLPAVMDDRACQALWETARASLDAVGHRFGATHTEIIYRSATPAVVEINTRMGGDRIWEMVQIGTGVDLVSAVVCTLAHDAFDLPAARHTLPAAVRFLTAEPGRVVAVHGVDDALALNGVMRIGDLPRVGDVVRPLRSSIDRAGYVLGAGPEPDVETVVKAGAASIVIETAPLAESESSAD